LRFDKKGLNNRFYCERAQSADISRVFTSVELSHVDNAPVQKVGDLLGRIIHKHADRLDFRIEQPP